jgi:DNA-binding transcriptional regulator YhcF (GntR family)
LEDKVYRNIAHQLEDDILSGTLREGDALPSTHVAAERFDVNPATVTRAMTLLDSQGLLDKRRGIGLYVAIGARDRIWKERRRVFREESLASLADEARKIGISKQELIAMLMTM